VIGVLKVARGFSRHDFAYDHKRDCYICPAGQQLRQRQKIYRLPRPLVDRNGMMRYRASKLDCQNCSLKPQCCPNAPARKIPRSIHEGARDLARDIAKTEAYRISRCQRKKVEMLFTHLKRILKLDRLRLRGPNSTSPPPLRTSGSSRSWFRQRRQCQRGEATPLINSADSSRPAAPGSLKNLLFQRYHPIPAVRSTRRDRLNRVDSCRSFRPGKRRDLL
jgi:hypothetical protein